MKVSEVLPEFDGNKAQLARVLGITRAAVSLWGDEDIPEKQALKLRYEILPAMRVAKALSSIPDAK